MNFFKRLKNIVTIKADKALDKHENPVELLELSINKKEKLLTDAKKQCAKFIASIDSMRKECDDLKNKAHKYEEATKAALSKGDNSKAQEFVKQKIELAKKYEEALLRVTDQENKAANIKSKISELEIEISNMKSKKQELATRLDVAEINSDINETLAGLSDDHGISLDELEKKVTEKENYGSALEDMKPKDENTLLDEYINTSPSADSKINEELEKMKREMGLTE